MKQKIVYGLQEQDWSHSFGFWARFQRVDEVIVAMSLLRRGLGSEGIRERPLTVVLSRVGRHKIFPAWAAAPLTPSSDEIGGRRLHVPPQLITDM